MAYRLEVEVETSLVRCQERAGGGLQSTAVEEALHAGKEMAREAQRPREGARHRMQVESP